RSSPRCRACRSSRPTASIPHSSGTSRSRPPPRPRCCCSRPAPGRARSTACTGSPRPTTPPSPSCSRRPRSTTGTRRSAPARARALGVAAAAVLRVARRPLAHADGDPVEAAAPAPEAFVLRRAACQRLGPFDEDLLGSVALHEYALRARAVGFRCVGFPSAVVDVPATCRLVEADATRERDRLTMLARHRPQELYPALAAFADFWTMAEADRRAWLRGLLARLPDAARIGPEFDVLIAQADELARRAVPAEPLDRALGALEQT